jgi:predicted permease
MSKLFRRFQHLLRSRQNAADLAEELELHRSLKQQELEEAGVPREEACYAAQRDLGNVTLAREEARSVWIRPWLESVWQDLVYGFRSLRRQPGFTLVALVALGSAIGLNTSLFTTFSALALRPWPVKNPERIVKVFQVSKSTPDGGAHGFSIAEYRYLSESAKSFTGMVAIRDAGFLKLESGTLNAEYVSGNYFGALAVDLERGRGFRTDEDRPESPEAVAVISYRTWQTRFGSDPDIVGRQVHLEGIPLTVVGVASERFAGTSPQPLDVWIPLSAMSLLKPHDNGIRTLLTSPDHCCGDMAGRLAAGVSREQARAELELLSDGYRGHHTLESRGILLTGSAVLADPGSKRRKIYPAFGLMFLGVMLVLLLACANVGNLLLARAAARRREIALRLSLGAGRRRVIRQLLTESLLLASIAGAIGIAVAFVLPRLVLTRMVGQVALQLEPDAPVLAFTLGISILACLVFGLAPALHGTRGDLNSSLKDRFEGAGLRLSLRGSLLAV